MINKCKTAFTLAEVLITLGIIGVVAAMTIPTLLTNYNKKQYYTQFMKARSALENAIRLYEDEHGVLFYCNDYDPNDQEPLTDEKVRNLASYFSGVSLITSDNYADFLEGYNKINVKTNYDGSGDTLGSEDMWNYWDNENIYGFMTNEGMLFMPFWDYIGGEGYVDINGPNSGPNTLGRDIFTFYLDSYDQKDRWCGSMWGMNTQCSLSENGYVSALCYGNNMDGSNCAARLIERGSMDY